jgi:hypothetical protein
MEERVTVDVPAEKFIAGVMEAEEHPEEADGEDPPQPDDEPTQEDEAW